MKKKYIAVAAAVLCFAVQAVAQPVIVEKTGRSAKSYYSPDRGVTIDFNIGYTLGLGNAREYANSTPLPSYHVGVSYAFNKNWQIGLAYQNAYLQQDMGPKLFTDGYSSLYGHAVHNINFHNVLLSGEYDFPISRWVRPYVKLSIGPGSVKVYTDVAAKYTYEDAKWMFVASPEVGIRGFFDKKTTVGYMATASYTQYLGSASIIDGDVSSPCYFRIGAGIFVKFM